MKSKDYAGAKEAAAAALGGPGLSADQVVEASMILIEAALETKDLETADSKLSEVEGVATDMGKVCVLRGRYWRKKGDETKAQKSFQDARLHDPNVLIPN
jgi:Tfp pilus assembly protein PilF